MSHIVTLYSRRATILSILIISGFFPSPAPSSLETLRVLKARFDCFYPLKYSHHRNYMILPMCLFHIPYILAPAYTTLIFLRVVN